MASNISANSTYFYMLCVIICTCVITKAVRDLSIVMETERNAYWFILTKSEFKEFGVRCSKHAVVPEVGI